MIKEGYTRVSEIIGWYKSLKLGAIDPGVLKRKTQVGTDVHEAISGFYTDSFVPLDQKALPYYESFKRWDSSQEMKIVKQEQRYYCDDLKITGAVDMIANFSGHTSLVDFKTSAVADEVAWILQGSFYVMLCDEFIDTVKFVKLDKSGGAPKVFEFTPCEQKETMALKCLEVFRYWNH